MKVRSEALPMPPDKDFIHALQAAWPPDQWESHAVVVALSGGADSLALLQGLHHLSGGGAQLIVGHVNHHLRGKESDDDARCVIEICQQLGLQYEIHHAPTLPQGGMEEAARNIRYAFLTDLAQRRHARYVVTAHTADDQVETILHRILRGTGPRGLAGIAERRLLAPSVTLVRPMLAIHRKMGVDFLEAISQPYQTDSTNTDTRMTRNRLRHDLLPLLREKYNQNVDAALLRLGHLSGQMIEEIDQQIEKLENRAIECSGPQQIIFHTDVLREAGPYLATEIIKHVWREAQWPEQTMDRRAWESLSPLIFEEEEGKPRSKAIASKHDLPGGIRATREGERLILECSKNDEK